MSSVSDLLDGHWQDDVVTRYRRLTVAHAILVVSLAACSTANGRSSSAHLVAGWSPLATVPVQTGYARSEAFCATGPLTGRIAYEVSKGNATLVLAVAGLPRDATVGVDWLNDTVRGYTIASFATDREGGTVQGSLRLFRPGEKKAIGLLMTTTALTPKTVGRLQAC
jgi:hypothetical protein